MIEKSKTHNVMDLIVWDPVKTAKNNGMKKETKKQNDSEEKFELDKMQLKILEDEYHQNMVTKEIRDQEYEESIYEYQTKHHLSRSDAIISIARDRLEY